MHELPIIQKAYDLIRWYVPILNRLPRGQKFVLGDRITTGLYDLLEGLILARFAEKKRARLQALNGRLDVLRYQTRLLLDFELIEPERYRHAGLLINAVGVELDPARHVFRAHSRLRVVETLGERHLERLQGSSTP